MKPLTNNQMKSFVRFPTKNPKVFQNERDNFNSANPINKPVPRPKTTMESRGSSSFQKISQEPGTSSAVHSARSLVRSSGQSGPSPGTAPRHPFAPKDYRKTNDHITKQINTFEKYSNKKVGSPQPNTTNTRIPTDSSRDRDNQKTGTSQSTIPNTEYTPTSQSQIQPGTSSVVHSSNSQVGSSSESRPSLSAHSLSLVVYLLEMKFLTFSQVSKKFLKNESDALGFNKLLTAGLIKTKTPELTPDTLIIPTEKGYELIKSENPTKDIPKPIKRVFDPAVNHDLTLVDIRMRFEELNFIQKWYSEKSLEEVAFMNRHFQDLPDAICKKKNEKGYFLELEISQKTHKAYEERIRRYQELLELQEFQEQGIEGVIFLCTDEKVCEIIKSKLPDSKNFSCLMLTRYLKSKEKAA